MSPRIVAFLTAGALAAAAALPYLLDLGYLPLDGEAVILTAGAVLVLGGLGWLLRPVERAYHVLLGLLIYWIADSYFVNSQNLVPLAGLAGIATYVLLRTRLRANLQPMLLTFAVFWIGSNLLGPARQFMSPPFEQGLAGKDGLPPIIHVILDEQGSPEATEGAIPKGHPAENITGKLVAAGYQVRPNTMSASEYTRYSISGLFGLAGNLENFGEGGGEYSFGVKDNRFLKQLAAGGYRVTVVQSNYLDICAKDPAISCHTYNRTGNGHAFAGRTGDLLLRTRLALMELHSYLNGAQEFGGVFAYNLAARLMRRYGVRANETVYYSRPPALIGLIDELRPRFEKIGYGEAYVMHLIVPHTPYVMTAGCGIQDPSRFAQRAGEDVAPLKAEDIYPIYWDQSVCAIDSLLTALEGLEKSEAGRKAIVMIHGDHGARITIGETKDASRERQRDMKQTLFALRDPAAPGGIDRSEVALQDIFRDTVNRLVFGATGAGPVPAGPAPALHGSLAAN